MPDTPSVIILHGNDEFAISAHIAKLCASLGDPSSADMNIARFDGRSGLDYEALNKAINSIPFLAPRRVVVLMHPISAFNSAEGRKKFLELLDKAQPTTTIALAEYDELKRDHWLLKWAAGAGSRAGVHIYNMPKRWEMPRWIESETKKLGGRIEPEAAARLSEMVGEDTRIASQELTKLLTYANYERSITLLDVERVSIVSAQGNVFELVDALGQGDGKKAQRVLHQLLEEEEAYELWGMVIRQFRLLLQARELIDSNASIPEVQKALGLHEFVVGKVYAQAKRFPLETLEVIYHKLLEIDERDKLIRLPPEERKEIAVPLDLALDTLIVELTRK
jgi:DNA polymerase-3 subunit delta